MVFKDYKYGCYKIEIRTLLKKRLNLRDKVRYHRYKIEELENQLSELEIELDNYLKKAGNKI